jgi:hypothetical protein
MGYNWAFKGLMYKRPDTERGIVIVVVILLLPEREMSVIK